MSPQGNDDADKTLGDIVVEVSEKASLLVREEIELAKAEVTTKAKTLARGAAVGAAAGVFLALAAIYFLHALAYFFQDLFDSPVWVGYLIVVAILAVLGVIAGLLAKRWLSEGPPTPDLAIEQAKLTRQDLESQGVERDQLARSLDRSGTSGEG
jgi:MFS family permease